MAIAFDPRADLETTEAHLVDWKQRAQRYKRQGVPVPKHVQDRIRMLKADARLLRQQNGETR